MAKEAQFKFEDLSFSTSFTKVDRKKIYGFTQLEVTTNGEKCSTAVVSEDGRYILPSGCSGIQQYNSAGEYVSRSDMIALTEEGKPAEKVLSTFEKECVELKAPQNLDDYFNLQVKGVYQLNLDEEKNNVIAKLQETKVLQFEYNYRTDYEGDDAFLLTQSDEVFMVIGKIVPFEYLGFEQEIHIEEDEEADDEELDFGML